MSYNSADLDEARECRRVDPYRALGIADQHIAKNPTDAQGYFSRHLTWRTLHQYDKALADCTEALRLDPDCCTFLCRGEVHRALNDHVSALSDLNHAYDLSPEEWRTSFGPHLRADTLARLGRLDEALADCRLISDDHWMPAHSDLPGGNKEQFIAEIKRRAAAAMKR